MFQNKVQSIVNPLYFLLKEQPKLESLDMLESSIMPSQMMPESDTFS